MIRLLAGVAWWWYVSLAGLLLGWACCGLGCLLASVCSVILVLVGVLVCVFGVGFGVGGFAIF